MYDIPAIRFILRACSINKPVITSLVATYTQPTHNRPIVCLAHWKHAKFSITIVINLISTKLNRWFRAESGRVTQPSAFRANGMKKRNLIENQPVKWNKNFKLNYYSITYILYLESRAANLKAFIASERNVENVNKKKSIAVVKPFEIQQSHTHTNIATREVYKRMWKMKTTSTNRICVRSVWHYTV